MKRSNFFAFAASAFLFLGLSTGYAQDSDEVMIDEDSAATSIPADMGSEEGAPVDDEQYEYSSEEEY